VTTATSAPTPTEANANGSEDFSLGQRIALWVVSHVGYLAIRLIGPTLRWTVSFEVGGPNSDRVQPVILVFWHRCVFAATWWFRHRDIQVMTSRSFDGEYIARIIEMFGYGAVRGSSSRGGVRALLGMHKEIEQGKPVAFTIDGPRGPVYVAKPGPVLLARNTGVPLVCFYIAVEKAWVLNTWDRFMIPKPFSRAHLRLGKTITVPREADSAALEQFHREMQATLERIREAAESAIESGNREIR
jgi:lysophospholipid acyltransferase (LPLAT)-like uncharacterized protein